MRAAVVGGVAYHAGKRSSEKQAYAEEQDARLSALEEQQYSQQPAAAPPPPAAAPPPPAGGMSDATIQQLQQLGQLKEQGILTDEEFEAQKRKLLGM